MKKNQAPWYATVSSKKKPATKDATPKSTKKHQKTPPILALKITPEKELDNFERAYAYALKMSDPASTEPIYIHLNMAGELLFDVNQDEAFHQLWKSQQLMCLIKLPRNWKTMPLEETDEEDLDDLNLNDPKDRFDYLYETGMFIAE